MGKQKLSLLFVMGLLICSCATGSGGQIDPEASMGLLESVEIVPAEELPVPEVSLPALQVPPDQEPYLSIDAGARGEDIPVYRSLPVIEIRKTIPPSPVPEESEVWSFPVKTFIPKPVVTAQRLPETPLPTPRPTAKPTIRPTARATAIPTPKATPFSGETSSGRKVILEPVTPKPTSTPAASDEAIMVITKPGDEVEIILQGDGWIFPGFLKEEDMEGLSFRFREMQNNETRFLFKTKKPGEYELKFLLQNNYTGDNREQLYRVKVVPEERFDSALKESREPEAVKPADSRTLESLNTLYESGKYVQALTGYLKNYDDSSPQLNDRIADIYEKLEDYDVASGYWAKNLEAGDYFRKKAVSGIVRGAIQSGDLNTVLKYMDEIPFSGNGEQAALAVARFLDKKGRPGLSIEYLKDYLSLFPRGRYLDEVYFLLGQLYEQDSSWRDLKLSREFYQRVNEGFPESSLAGAASERVKYLDRHFLVVW